MRFEVADTGIGIATEAQARLFQAFSQADASTTRRYGGTGLGLMICKQFAELMGGTIGVESKLGQGSTFWFTARLEKQLLTPQAASALLTPTPRRDAPPLRTANNTQSHARILVAEDNTIGRRVVARLLEKLGYRVDVVANGCEAVDLCSRIPYAAILMDCQMPEMDGFEATQIIRAQERQGAEFGVRSPALAHLPIIAITANAMPGDLERCLAVGMDDYLTKPIRVQELDAILQRWVAGVSERTVLHS